MNSIRTNTRKGQAAIFMTMSLLVLLGLMGLVVDVGWAYWRKEAAKTAAQSAAYGAIKYLDYNNLSACGVAGFVCQNATACPASPASPPTTAMGAGCLYAKQNGFINSGQQNVTMEAHGPDGVHSPAATGTSLPIYWVSYTVTEHIPQLFSAVLGQQWNTVTGRATAAIFSRPSDACIYALSTTGTGLSIGGNDTITSACGIYVDSSDASNAMVEGGSASVTASTIKVVGGFNHNGSSAINPWPTTNADYTPDPLGWIYAPAVPSRCDSNGLTANSGNVSMGSDGFYVVCTGGFTMTANRTVNLTSGIYVINGGTMDLRNGTLRASGPVMFYFTGNVTSISINGNIDILLNAPSSGPYQGVLLWGDRSRTIGSININGGSQMQLRGALYFPTSTIGFTGGTSVTAIKTALVGNVINFIGNSYFAADPGGTYTALGLPRVGFIE